jgi:hypothetical protein
VRFLFVLGFHFRDSVFHFGLILNFVMATGIYYILYNVLNIKVLCLLDVGIISSF